MIEKIYYVEKLGVYSHGLHWAGTSLPDAKFEAQRLADMDEDDYHRWVVRQYPENGPTILAEYRKHQLEFDDETGMPIRDEETSHDNQ